jgi:hypothetical protein
MWKFPTQVIGKTAEHLTTPRFGPLLPENSPADPPIKLDHRRINDTLRAYLRSVHGILEFRQCARVVLRKVRL